MQLVADLHLHSKYSRATSKTLDVQGLYQWSQKKGINLIGTADFTHPLWFAELKKGLEALGNGLYHMKGTSDDVYYVLTSEISSIYSDGGKLRRIHNVLLAPSLETVEKINTALGKRGNLYADGRPIFGISAYDLLKLVKDIDRRVQIIPAHIWTPWFSLFGSMSGFDSIKECFKDLSKEILAIETGLSSDPLMNWRLSGLDNVAIVSFGDGHSGPNLMREATIFDLPELSYDNIVEALRNSNANTYLLESAAVSSAARVGSRLVSAAADRAAPHALSNTQRPSILNTIEFFPEEGKYHWDGHRDHKIRLSPEETKKLNGICPQCHRPVTVGVEYRVEQLADRTVEQAKKHATTHRPPFKKFVQLSQIIAESFGMGEQSQKVKNEYERMIAEIGNEYHILVELDPDDLRGRIEERIVEGLKRVRAGTIHIEPGYDGEFGIVKVFEESEIKPKTAGKTKVAPGQAALF